MARTLDQITQYKIRGPRKMRDRSFYTRFFEGFFSENGFSSLIFIENSVGLTLENRLLAGVIIFTLLFMYFLVFLGGGAKKDLMPKRRKCGVKNSIKKPDSDTPQYQKQKVREI